jgi:hypothetical protein
VTSLGAGLCLLGTLVVGTAACGADRTMSTPDTTAPPAAATEVPTSAAVPTTDDPADTYLGETTEIFRRPLESGRDFVVRLSDATYAHVFGLTWVAPTGSADLCFGDHAMFLGVPGEIGWWGSAWTATSWFDEPTPPGVPTLQASMSAAGDGDGAGLPPEYLLIRLPTDSTEAVLETADGTELDRSSADLGLTMLIMRHGPAGDERIDDLRVRLVGIDGQASLPQPLAVAAPARPSECGPGEAPRRPLPQPGAQPADPIEAEAAIRDRLALLVDPTIPADQKPQDLLDDDTGVQAATVEAQRGPYGDLAASARYTVDELVFTRPTEAWFRYTITTSRSTFADRFGQAVFDGAVWRITRATICQDLALAQAPCHPPSSGVELPADPAWQAAWEEWMSRAVLYAVGDGCQPLTQC